MKTLELYASISNSSINLGDYFGYTLIKHYAKKRIKVNLNKSIPNKPFLATVGSILANFNYIKTKCDIIGSGFISEAGSINNNNINIKGVRGPLTQSKLSNKNEVPVISDPGLLLSDVFDKYQHGNKKTKIGYIVHSVDRPVFYKMFPNCIDNIIDNYSNYKEFISNLLKYDFVFSSSLHGLVFSHSFSVPCRHMFITNKVIGNNFKFKDYYLSLQSTPNTLYVSNSTLFDTELISDNINVEIINNYKNVQKDIINKYLENL